MPKMAVPAALSVLPERKVVMQLTDSIGKGGLIFRYDDEVDVVVHEAVADQFDLILLQIFGEQFEIDGPVVVREEDDLAMIAPLGHMVHPTGNYDTGSARHHTYRFATGRSISIECTIPTRREIS